MSAILYPFSSLISTFSGYPLNSVPAVFPYPKSCMGAFMLFMPVSFSDNRSRKFPLACSPGSSHIWKSRIFSMAKELINCKSAYSIFFCIPSAISLLLFFFLTWRNRFYQPAIGTDQEGPLCQRAQPVSLVCSVRMIPDNFLWLIYILLCSHNAGCTRIAFYILPILRL